MTEQRKSPLSRAWAAMSATRWRLFAIAAVVSLVADQATKIWARASLPTTPDGRGIPVSIIENFWDWRLSENPGSAFGLFGGQAGARIFLSIIGVIALGAIIWMLKKTKPEYKRLITALGLVAGGAIGNLVDRILFGVVTDFVVWRYYAKEWPTFNIADVALVLGVGLLFLDLGKLEESDEDSEAGDSKKKKTKKPRKKRVMGPKSARKKRAG